MAAASTFTAYRRPLANALDDMSMPLSSSSASATAVVIPLLVSALANAAVTTYNGHWIYVASGLGASAQRRIRTDGYGPSTGGLAVDPPWTAPSSSVLEITNLFPCVPPPFASDDSYLTLINRALAKLKVRREITLAATLLDVYPLTLYPWLDRESRLIQVLEPAPISGRHPVDASWRRPRLRLSGASTSLQLDVPLESATGVLTLVCDAPADSLISGIESVIGLNAEDHTALASVRDVVEVGKMEAYLSLANRAPARLTGDWQKKYETQRDWVEQNIVAYEDYRDASTAPAAPQEAA